MRILSGKEKAVLKILVGEKSNCFHLSDFLKPFWPSQGALEVSTYQQVLQIYVGSEEDKQVLMNHLVDTLSLVRQLHAEGLLNTWNQVPLNDNTRLLGENKEGVGAQILPDITVATDMLMYENYQISFSDALKTYIENGFQKQAEKRAGLRFILSMAAMIIIIILLGLDILMNYRVLREDLKQDHIEINEKSEVVLENQSLNQSIIDSMQAQNKDLLKITKQISIHTENSKTIEQLLKQQGSSISRLEKSNKNVAAILVKYDSLLRIE